MVNKNTDIRILKILAIIAVIFIVLVVVAVVGYIGYGMLQKGGIVGRDSMSDRFHLIFDAMDGDLLGEGEDACDAAGGEFKDDDSALGCFDMPSGTFDTDGCDAVELKSMENICNTLEGATWVCKSTDVGCYY